MSRPKVHVHSFAPLAAPNATLVILGSMPGRASLLANQYYAHPRNAFWPIMGALFGAGADIPYARRVRMLKHAGVAVWDVLASCTRGSSLDSDIDEESIVPNDFASFFRSHPRIRRVFFNGTKAEASFRRYVVDGLGETTLRFERLPSTSPANASWSQARKVKAWRSALISVREISE
ncbi:MAG: DNA-deoxyinosine glycosylase [Betaproteobacteria bacterium RIFCSPLOWO2_02_FULL_63_19]|nr:MAG: DNA-deoxyinosine glycosylase [Betaproteobacteria bacterium RIFCSPLOWO2_02_FULL_63_19]